MTQYGRKLLDYIHSNQSIRYTAQEIFLDPKSNFENIDNVIKAIHELANEGIISLNNDLGTGFEVI